jgi:hypothetical protein
MAYDRQDSMAKAKSGKEPQKLKASLTAPKGYANSLDNAENARDKRRSMLTKQFNKVVKDKF